MQEYGLYCVLRHAGNNHSHNQLAGKAPQENRGGSKSSRPVGKQLCSPNHFKNHRSRNNNKMTSLISKHIEIYGGELALREKSRSSTRIMARLILPNGRTVAADGVTVDEALQGLHSALEAEEMK